MLEVREWTSLPYSVQPFSQAVPGIERTFLAFSHREDVAPQKRSMKHRRDEALAKS